MQEKSLVTLTLSFDDPDLDAEEKDEEVQKLLNQMKELDEIEESDRILDPNPPEGNKALGGFLVGMLTAVVKPDNIKIVFGFLSERLKGKPIEIAVKAPDGRELSIKANSQDEFEYAFQKAQEFLNS
ncbi:MAG: hypothetical protein AB4063_19300 [Crocosphaera sp.]